jgi:hypothetical protein
VADVRRAAHREDPDSLCGQVATAAFSERLHGVLVADPFDQHDGASVEDRSLAGHRHPGRVQLRAIRRARHSRGSVSGSASIRFAVGDPAQRLVPRDQLPALEQARSTGEIVASAGAGRTASASRRDFAEAAAVVLTEDGSLQPPSTRSTGSVPNRGLSAPALS